MPRYEAHDGALLHYELLDAGRGDASTDPVVVLAGGAARHPEYLGSLAGLDEHHDLVVPHLRGVGESPRATERECGSYWRQAEDLEALRLHLDVARLTLVAHSAGTRLAMAYAAQYGKKVARLVLITPPALHIVNEASDIDALTERRSTEPTFVEALAAQTGGPPTETETAFNSWMVRTAPVGYARWGTAEQRHSLLGHWDLAAAQAYFSMEPPESFVGQLARVEAPVLVIAGAEDCLTGFAPVVALAQLFPAGETAVINRCGHYPWVEEPKQFRRAIDEFLGTGETSD